MSGGGLIRMVNRFLGVVFAALLGLPGAALAFHSGGVGTCSGCHTTHADAPGSGFSLLKGSNPSDVCLTCHATATGSTWAPDPLVPGPQFGGGSFSSLKSMNLNDGSGGATPMNWIPGSKGGHSVISDLNGGKPDPDHTTTDASFSYPAANLHCTSCHDPHGKGGHFRLLYGSDFPNAVVNGQPFTFKYPAPAATGIDVEGSPESPANHTAYQSGISQWCGNCHEAYLSNHAGTWPSHPVDVALDSNMLRQYNAYRGTGFMDGTGADAYIPEVPVEFPGNTPGFRGPVPSGAKVTCVSCHRAHASSGPESGRWDFNIGTWAEEGVASGSYRIPNPYSATAGTAQRGLCEKCHDQPVGKTPTAPLQNRMR